MKCPYCNNEMILGIIHGRRDPIEWIPKDKDKGTILSHFIKGIRLTDWCYSKIEGYYCRECSKITINVPKQL